MAPTSVPDFSQWKMNHTMIRVKDPHKSIDFYQKLGFSLVDTLRQPEAQFDLYFLGHDAQGKSPSAGKQRSDRQGLLELTHNYGTESDEEYTVSNGNDEPHLGFQHLGIAVDDIDAARERLISLAVDRYVRTGEQGGRQTGAGRNEMAILQDPDGYYVELNPKGSTTAGTDISNYLFNFTGLRIKDPRVSLPWYTNVLGLKLHQQEGGENVTTYWLGYPGDSQSGSPRSVLEREGIVKLIWIHGSELEEGQVYHNGNNQPQGFGHLAIAVHDIEAACDWFETQGVNWKKRLTEGRLKSIAFVLDPDEYWIEIIQNARIKEPLGVQ